MASSCSTETTAIRARPLSSPITWLQVRRAPWETRHPWKWIPGPLFTMTRRSSPLLSLDGGGIILRNSTAVLSGPVSSHGGGIAGYGTTITQPITLNGGIAFFAYGSRQYVNGGIVESSPGSTVTVEGDSASLVVLGGLSTYTGPTQVYGGTLQVDGTIQNTSDVVLYGGTLCG